MIKMNNNNKITKKLIYYLIKIIHNKINKLKKIKKFVKENKIKNRNKKNNY